MTETSTRETTSYTSADQSCQKNINAQAAMSSPGSRGTNYSSDDEKKSEETAQGSDYEEPKAPGLKRKASTLSLTEAKCKRQTEDQVLEESDLDPVDPKEKIKNLMIHVDSLKAECTWKDNQIEKLKVELDEKADEIKKLIATNSRYKSGLACIICTDYLANPCTITCGHSFCYSCLREWLKTNRENGSQCPSCRTEITAQPVLSYALKNQVEAFVEQLPPEEKKRVIETLEKEDQMYKQISDHWAGMFDQSNRPLLDLEDGVLRCPNCTWEVEGSVCGKCNQHIDMENRDNDSDDDDDSNNDGGDDSEVGNESDTYDSNDSFIDDGSDNGSRVIEDNDLPPIVIPDDPVNNNGTNNDWIAGEQISANDIDENENESPHAYMNRPFNTIVINDSNDNSSELSESIEEKNVIVISSGEDNTSNLKRSQPTSPLSISSYEENHEDENYGVTNSSSDEESYRIHINTNHYLDQDNESQEEYTESITVMNSEVEYTEYNSDIHISSDFDDDDGSYHVHLY